MCGIHAISFGSRDFLSAWNVHGHVLLTSLKSCGLGLQHIGDLTKDSF
jgi:hypothetical protein